MRLPCEVPADSVASYVSSGRFEIFIQFNLCSVIIIYLLLLLLLLSTISESAVVNKLHKDSNPQVIQLRVNTSVLLSSDVPRDSLSSVAEAS